MSLITSLTRKEADGVATHNEIQHVQLHHLRCLALTVKPKMKMPDALDRPGGAGQVSLDLAAPKTRRNDA